MVKIAVIATVWFPLSHADVIVSRWIRPFPTDGICGWSRPVSTIISAYIEQRPENDIGVKFCWDNGISLFETIEQALTLGTPGIAVDGFLIFVEQGYYPRNEYGQKLYPRKRLFDTIAKVFRTFGRAVPVFNDKHFSWDFGESCEMLETARQLGFPLYGGSSLPHCPCDPRASVENGESVRDAVVLFFGDPDDYGFHSIEFAQAYLERRGETGVRAVRALEGRAAIDEVLARKVPEDLLHEALVCHGYPADPDTVSFIMERTEGLVLFEFEYLDGLRVSHLLIPKWVSDWMITVRLSSGEIRSCRVTAGDGARGFFQNFAFLNVQLERFFMTGQPPTPTLRTHLATGMLQAALQALRLDGRWIGTPQLSIAY